MATLNELIAQLNASSDNILSDAGRLNTVADNMNQTLDGMGFNDINEVRQGKYFEIDTKENDPKKAKDKVEEMCKKLLANLVIENYKIIDVQ